MLQYLHQYCFLETQYLSNQAEYKRTWSRSRSSEVILCHDGVRSIPEGAAIAGSRGYRRFTGRVCDQPGFQERSNSGRLAKSISTIAGDVSLLVIRMTWVYGYNWSTLRDTT